MKEIIGGILSVAGLIGVIFYGYQYLEDSESTEVLGADIAVSTGDWVPILISLIVLIVGVVIYKAKDSGLVKFLYQYICLKISRMGTDI